MKTVKIVSYGKERKVFVSVDGNEIVRFDGLDDEEAGLLVAIIEGSMMTILDKANEYKNIPL